MKKILCAFLMILVSGIANANIHIDGKVARKIVLEHIDQEYQVPALQEYNVQLKATGNYTMQLLDYTKYAQQQDGILKNQTAKQNVIIL